MTLPPRRPWWKPPATPGQKPEIRGVTIRHSSKVQPTQLPDPWPPFGTKRSTEENELSDADKKRATPEQKCLEIEALTKAGTGLEQARLQVATKYGMTKEAVGQMHRRWRDAKDPAKKKVSPQKMVSIKKFRKLK